MHETCPARSRSVDCDVGHTIDHCDMFSPLVKLNPSRVLRREFDDINENKEKSKQRRGITRKTRKRKQDFLYKLLKLRVLHVRNGLQQPTATGTTTIMLNRRSWLRANQPSRAL